MKTCKRCDIVGNFNHDYCYSCGDKLVESKRCLHCEEQLLNFYKFCPKCGLSVEPSSDKQMHFGFFGMNDKLTSSTMGA